MWHDKKLITFDQDRLTTLTIELAPTLNKQFPRFAKLGLNKLKIISREMEQKNETGKIIKSTEYTIVELPQISSGYVRQLKDAVLQFELKSYIPRLPDQFLGNNREKLTFEFFGLTSDHEERKMNSVHVFDAPFSKHWPQTEDSHIFSKKDSISISEYNRGIYNAAQFKNIIAKLSQIETELNRMHELEKAHQKGLEIEANKKKMAPPK